MERLMDSLQQVIDKLIDLSVNLLYAISEITAMHLPDSDLGCCKECFQSWPCRTVNALTEAFHGMEDDDE
jgi:hypothetical protein